jgi:hypothetical protein
MRSYATGPPKWNDSHAAITLNCTSVVRCALMWKLKHGDEVYDQTFSLFSCSAKGEHRPDNYVPTIKVNFHTLLRCKKCEVSAYAVA